MVVKNVGATVGSCSVGASDTDGDDVGLAVGDDVGVAVGDDVGLAVGDDVGLAVGDDVGLAVGDDVGVAVGEGGVLEQLLESCEE
jgi:hypothetical protein